jgi:hypothetical protein
VKRLKNNAHFRCSGADRKEMERKEKERRKKRKRSEGKNERKREKKEEIWKAAPH